VLSANSRALIFIMMLFRLFCNFASGGAGPPDEKTPRVLDSPAHADAVGVFFWHSGLLSDKTLHIVVVVVVVVAHT